jgi:hypothetical protein
MSTTVPSTNTTWPDWSQTARAFSEIQIVVPSRRVTWPRTWWMRPAVSSCSDTQRQCTGSTYNTEARARGSVSMAAGES